MDEKNKISSTVRTKMATVYIGNEEKTDCSRIAILPCLETTLAKEDLNVRVRNLTLVKK